MKVGDLVKYIGNDWLVGDAGHGRIQVHPVSVAHNMVFTIDAVSLNYVRIKDFKGCSYTWTDLSKFILFNEAESLLSKEELERINTLNHV